MKRASIVSVRGIVAIALLLILSVGAFVIWRASRALHSAAADVHAAHEIRFAVRPLAPHSIAFARTGVELEHLGVEFGAARGRGKTTMVSSSSTSTKLRSSATRLFRRMRANPRLPPCVVV